MSMNKSDKMDMEPPIERRQRGQAASRMNANDMADKTELSAKITNKARNAIHKRDQEMIKAQRDNRVEISQVVEQAPGDKDPAQDKAFQGNKPIQNAPKSVKKQKKQPPPGEGMKTQDMMILINLSKTKLGSYYFENFFQQNYNLFQTNFATLLVSFAKEPTLKLLDNVNEIVQRRIPNRLSFDLTQAQVGMEDDVHSENSQDSVWSMVFRFLAAAKYYRTKTKSSKHKEPNNLKGLMDKCANLKGNRDLENFAKMIGSFEIDGRRSEFLTGINVIFSILLYGDTVHVFENFEDEFFDNMRNCTPHKMNTFIEERKRGQLRYRTIYKNSIVHENPLERRKNEDKILFGIRSFKEEEIDWLQNKAINMNTMGLVFEPNFNVQTLIDTMNQLLTQYERIVEKEDRALTEMKIDDFGSASLCLKKTGKAVIGFPNLPDRDVVAAVAFQAEGTLINCINTEIRSRQTRGNTIDAYIKDMMSKQL